MDSDSGVQTALACCIFLTLSTWEEVLKTACALHQCPVAQVAYRYHVISVNKHDDAVNILLLHFYFSSLVAVMESFQTVAINGGCCVQIFSLGLKLQSLTWIYSHFAPSCCRNTPIITTSLLIIYKWATDTHVKVYLLGSISHSGYMRVFDTLLFLSAHVTWSLHCAWGTMMQSFLTITPYVKWLCGCVILWLGV